MLLRDAIRRRPVVGVAVAVVIGAAGGIRSDDWRPAAIACLGAVAAAAFFRRRPDVRATAMLAATALAMGGWTAHQAGAAEADLALLHRVGDRYRVTVAATVGDEPSRRPASRGETCYRFRLAAPQLWLRHAHVPLRHVTVQAQWYGPADAASPRPGEAWLLQGRLSWPRPGSTFRSPVLVTRAASSQRLSPPPRGWRRACERARAEAARRLSRGIEKHPDMLALVQAIMLGYRGEMPPRLKTAFRHSGTIHIFAISGSHVVIILGLLVFVLIRTGLPRPLWVVVLAPTLLAYAVTTGGQPSAMRACLMSILYFAAPLLGRRPDTLSAMSLAALLLIVPTPLRIADIGLVLSFAVVAGLVLLAPPLSRRFRRWLRLDEARFDATATRQLGGELPPPRLRRFFTAAAVYASDLLAISVAAWVTSAPLTAFYFGLFAPVSLLANLLVVPLSFVVVLSGCVGLVVSSIHSLLGIAANHLTLGATLLMTAVARTAASVPAGVWRVPAPPLAFLLLWYACLVAWAWQMERTDRGTVTDTTWMTQ